ncbi:nuclear transport factor 2 family protein [Microbacterium sp. NPDC055910]|uniref:nuclear transport factor 2 family protein n=1 Tax=Microbacterium sp. NPDC055910 TaxID=3345659 RepID=UPI0035D96417
MSNAERFLSGYVEAWRTNEPDAIRALFTDDAVYRGSPDDLEPAVGIDRILALWSDERDEPGEWTFDGHVEIETTDAAAIRGVTTYAAGAKVGTYDNLWLVRFADDGRAREFTEWWIERKH